MKTLQLVTICLLATTFALDPFTSNSVSAQEKFKIGRGRLIRKWRDDLLGRNQQDPRQQQAQQLQQAKEKARLQANTKSKAKSNAKATGARATNPNTNAPTPAKRAQASQTQQRQVTRSRTGSYTSPSSDRRQAVGSGVARQDNGNRSSYQPTARTPASRNAPTPARSASSGGTNYSAKKSKNSASRSKAAKGFGMNVVEDKNENYLVSYVDPNGNAAQAGVKRGDRVVELGGIKLSSLEEYEGIVEILASGDQMELKLVRQGKKKEVFVYYGTPPKEVGEEEIIDDVPVAHSETRSMPATGKYDFVPKQTPNQYHSVLDNGASQGYSQNRVRQNSAGQSSMDELRSEVERLRATRNRSAYQPASSSTPSLAEPTLGGPTLGGPNK